MVISISTAKKTQTGRMSSICCCARWGDHMIIIHLRNKVQAADIHQTWSQTFKNNVKRSHRRYTGTCDIKKNGSISEHRG